MTDYIKREDAIKELLGCVPTDAHEIKDLDVIRVMLALPSADVAPVRHGRWVERCEDQDGIYEFCSECGIDTDITHYGESYAYCPNCGAKMDAKADSFTGK